MFAGLGLLLLIILYQTIFNIARVEAVHEVYLDVGLTLFPIHVLRVQLLIIHFVFTILDQQSVRGIFTILRVQAYFRVAAFALGSHLVRGFLMMI